MQKASPNGAQSLFGGFSRIPLLTSPRSLYAWDIPTELLLDDLSIFSLIFLAFISVLERSETNVFSWNGLAKNVIILYQNPTVIERHARSKYIQNIKQELNKLCYYCCYVRKNQILMSYLSFTIFFGFHLEKHQLIRRNPAIKRQLADEIKQPIAFNSYTMHIQM